MIILLESFLINFLLIYSSSSLLYEYYWKIKIVDLLKNSLAKRNQIISYVSMISLNIQKKTLSRISSIKMSRPGRESYTSCERRARLSFSLTIELSNVHFLEQHFCLCAPRFIRFFNFIPFTIPRSFTGISRIQLWCAFFTFCFSILWLAFSGYIFFPLLLQPVSNILVV